MNIVSTPSAAARTATPLASPAPAAINSARAVYRAAMQLLPFLETGKPVTTAVLHTAMTESFGGTDAQGYWVWKEAYEALEAAQVLFLRRFGPAILCRSTTPQATLAMMKHIADLLRRSRVMNDYRVELIGFTDAMVPRLKALGLISEIISWKLRLMAAQGSAILDSLLDRHTLIEVTERSAAA